MSNLFVPIEKADLSWNDDLPFSHQFNDIYHSHQGALEQSLYVFIEGNRLLERWQQLAPNQHSIFNVAETGFGTGLNFLLTLQTWMRHAPSNAQLHYLSCDKHPLDRSDLIRTLKQWPQLQTEAQQLIAQYPVLTPGYHHLHFLGGRVRLTLMLGDALECYRQLLICGDYSLEKKLRVSSIDAWYLDGFTPKKNSSIWSDSLFQVIAMLSKPGTTAATYSVANVVKNALQNSGFSIHKKKGFGPKRHMLSAEFTAHSIIPSRYKHTPWHTSIPCTNDEKKAIIIGAGLAGCFIANALALRGWEITLINEDETIGAGASANQQAVLFPKLSAYQSPLTQFMLSAFLYANRFYKQLLTHSALGDLCGSLMLAHNQKEAQSQLSLESWLHHYPELGELVDNQRASQLAGIQVEQGGLFIPLSGWMNSPALCRELIKAPGIQCITAQVNSLHYDNTWKVNDFTAPIVILASGYQVNQLAQSKELPIKPIRGQMSAIQANSQSAALRMPLCGNGHVLPAMNGIHHFGASYGLGSTDLGVNTEDDEANLVKLKQIAPYIIWQEQIVNQWVGIRAATSDYLPLVGPICKPDEFSALYQRLDSNAKRWIAEPGPYQTGLYAFSGFGSRGLTTIPLSAEYLASLLNHEMPCLPRNIIQVLSPARFLRKNIIRSSKS